MTIILFIIGLLLGSIIGYYTKQANQENFMDGMVCGRKELEDVEVPEVEGKNWTAKKKGKKK